MSNNLRQCVVCEREFESGLNIGHHFICPYCESAILETPMTDPLYEFYLARLRHLWNGPEVEAVLQR